MQYKKYVTITISLLLVSTLFLTSCGKKEAEYTPAPEQTQRPQKLEEPIEPTPKMVQEPKPVEKPKPIIDEGEKIYAVQLVSIRDHYRITLEQEKLQRFGYKTIISEFQKHGETYYRLRLDGVYTKTEATRLGKELKDKFISIKEYWIQKVL